MSGPYDVPAAPTHKAVTKSRKPTNHLLHLILTVCTLGLWGLFVWLPITLWHKFGPRATATTRYQ